MKLLKTYILLLFVLFGISQGICQNQYETINMEGFDYVKPNVENLLSAINSSTKDWETAMKKLGYSDRGVEDNFIYYGSGASLKNSVIAIKKRPEFIVMEHLDFSKETTIMDDLVSELENNFLQYRNKAAIYGFKGDQGNYNYIFSITRDAGQEFVILRKIKINKK